MTYNEYTGLGYSLVNGAEFAKYYEQARAFLKYYTEDRCDDEHCLCQLMDNYKTMDEEVARFSGRIRSESVLDHSVTLQDVTEESIEEEYGRKAIKIIRKYCWLSGGLYRGL